jgi:hypothetical protein
VAWKFTKFYDHSNVAKKKEAWALLQVLSQFQPTPWLCIGDFNEIINSNKKRGTLNRARWQMEAFQKTLEDCLLCDLDFKWPQFTWVNGRNGMDFIQERLDKAVANSEWCNFFKRWMLRFWLDKVQTMIHFFFLMQLAMNAYGDLGGSFGLRLAGIRWRVSRRLCTRPRGKNKMERIHGLLYVGI